MRIAKPPVLSDLMESQATQTNETLVSVLIIKVRSCKRTQYHSQLAEIQRPLKHVNIKRTYALKMVISPRCDEKAGFCQQKRVMVGYWIYLGKQAPKNISHPKFFQCGCPLLRLLLFVSFTEELKSCNRSPS